MTKRFIPAALAAATMSLALVACGEAADSSGEAPAASEAEVAGEADPISQRQDLLKAMGDSFRDIRGQLEEGTPDFAVISSNAQTIRTNAALIIDLFPAGTGVDSGADTEALETIWQDPETFAAAHERLMTASDGMVTAAASGDPAMVEAAVGDLGSSCKNCHDTFRLDDE